MAYPQWPWQHPHRNEFTCSSCVVVVEQRASSSLWSFELAAKPLIRWMTRAPAFQESGNNTECAPLSQISKPLSVPEASRYPIPQLPSPLLMSLFRRRAVSPPQSLEHQFFRKLRQSRERWWIYIMHVLNKHMHLLKINQPILQFLNFADFVLSPYVQDFKRFATLWGF